MEAEALQDFNAALDDELSFRKGDILKVLDMEDDKHWLRAELNGREGLIPYNYIQMKPHKWYSGCITKKEAEDLLKDRLEGNFLIRVGNSPGTFCLSVKLRDNVEHLRVLQNGTGKYILYMGRFSSVNELVQHYRTSFISRLHGICLTDPKDESQRVKALYNFEPQEEGELRMRKGDIVNVVEKVDQNWWKGTCDGRSGLFPVPYVKELNN